eukprot:g7466.t1
MAGVPILTLDADAEAPGFSSSVLRATTRSHDCLGARVLAAGRGRFAVWVGEGDSEEVQLAFHGKCGPAAAVRLLPGTTEDLLVIPDASLDAENDLLHSHPSFGLWGFLGRLVKFRAGSMECQTSSTLLP